MHEINGIKFEKSGEPFEIKGRGTVYPVKLVGKYTHTQVSKALLGAEWNGKVIKGVEMFAVEDQTNKVVGILI